MQAGHCLSRPQRQFLRVIFAEKDPPDQWPEGDYPAFLPEPTWYVGGVPLDVKAPADREHTLASQDQVITSCTSAISSIHQLIPE